MFYQVLHRAAHTIKGSAGNLYLYRLSDAGMQLVVVYKPHSEAKKKGQAIPKASKVWSGMQTGLSGLGNISDVAS